MLTLIGIGPGGTDALTAEAAAAIRASDCLIGATRMLASLPPCPGRRVTAYRPGEILDILEQERPERPCILYSYWNH